MTKASINIVTNRYGGLDAQLYYFSQQTFKDFELVILDDLYDERKELIENLSNKYNLNIIYNKPKRSKKNVVTCLHALYRNEALIYSNGEYIIFFDDYQIPIPTFVEEHLKYLNKNTGVVGQQILLKAMDINNPNLHDIKQLDPRNTENKVKEAHYGHFWTNNCSAPLDRIVEVNGFDERFIGGTGGEDYDLGLRLTKIGVKLIYNPNALCYHIDHDSIKTKSLAIRDFSKQDPISRSKFKVGECSHDVSPFVKNPYHDGDLNLMENEQFVCWWEDNVKHYKCKYCGVEGITDSLLIYYDNLKRKSPIAPTHLFDLKKEREQYRKMTKKIKSKHSWDI